MLPVLLSFDEAKYSSKDSTERNTEENELSHEGRFTNERHLKKHFIEKCSNKPASDQSSTPTKE